MWRAKQKEAREGREGACRVWENGMTRSGLCSPSLRLSTLGSRHMRASLIAIHHFECNPFILHIEGGAPQWASPFANNTYVQRNMSKSLP